MKILMFLASSLDGGAEKVVADLSNELARQGVSVTVAAFTGSRWLARLSDQVAVVRLPASESAYNPRLYFKLRQTIARLQPDVVHSHGAKASKIIARLRRVVRFTQVATKHNSRKGRVFNRLPYVTAVSGKVQQSITQPARVIFNGTHIDPALRPQILSEQVRLLAVGRLDPIKRFDQLIEAMSHLPEHISLDVVGDGPQRQALAALVDQLSLGERVQLLGQQNDVPRRMTQAHAVVIASRSEGYSLVMAEALFYGNVLLSTEVGAAPEILPAKFLISEGALVEKLTDMITHHADYRAEFRQFADANAETFTWPRIAHQYQEFYQAALAGNIGA